MKQVTNDNASPAIQDVTRQSDAARAQCRSLRWDFTHMSYSVVAGTGGRLGLAERCPDPAAWSES